jgi:hypothetical protein
MHLKKRYRHNADWIICAWKTKECSVFAWMQTHTNLSLHAQLLLNTFALPLNMVY